MASDRYLGLTLMALAALLGAVIVPWQVETVEYGWLRPRTLPYMIAVVLGLCGLALTLRPVGDARPGTVPWARASVFAVVLVAGLALMARVGFVWCAPPLALTLMLLAHERRPVWLVMGAAVMPALIWFAVAVLLERPLP
jgi:putative tricarboxylic transport membrane protein